MASTTASSKDIFLSWVLNKEQGLWVTDALTLSSVRHGLQQIKLQQRQASARATAKTGISYSYSKDRHQLQLQQRQAAATATAKTGSSYSYSIDRQQLQLQQRQAAATA